MAATSYASSRGWFLTINNFDEVEEEQLKSEKFEYLVYQVEKGEKEGTEHLHAFIYYKSERKFETMKKKFPGAHIEKVKRIKKCMEYCSKVKTRLRGPYEFGTKPKQGNRTDLDDLAEMVVNGMSMYEIAKADPAGFARWKKNIEYLKYALIPERTEKPQVWWLWGESGAGKTTYVHDKHGRGRKNIFIKDSTKWWDGYDGQKIVLIDDFCEWQWNFKNFLRALDAFDYSSEYKGGYVNIPCDFIYVTCTKHPNQIWEDEEDAYQVRRRCTKIKKLRPKPDRVKYEPEEDEEEV